MNRPTLVSLLVASLCALPTPAGSANASPAPAHLRDGVRVQAPVPGRFATLSEPEQTFELIDALAADLLATAKLPGLSVAILEDGEVAFARGYGFMDLDTRSPVTPETRFRCASVSKTITATAIARLLGEHRLDLDAPVTSYVPSWPADPAITPRELSGHLSGVAHYQGQDRIDRRRHYESVTEALNVFRDSPRAGAPGEAYVYSTHGYTLLSAVIEGASGLPFLDYLDQEIFEPLAMTGSGPDLRATPSPEMSTLYGRRQGEPALIPQPEDPSYKWAGGGLVSTPSDLVRMADAYMNGFISPEVVSEMFESQRTADGQETGVGITWRIGEDRLGRTVIHHSGSMGGARTTLLMVPEERLAVAVMTNTVWTSNIQRTGELLLEAFLAYTGEWLVGQDRTQTTGTLQLSGGAGYISMPAPFTEWTGTMAVERMPIRHLTGGTYLLTTPYGLVDLHMEVEGGHVRGEASVSSTRTWTFQVVEGGS
jgi:CubicO group peptidase (beta-lactamase class C family)